jgi:hypothetical protein
MFRRRASDVLKRYALTGEACNEARMRAVDQIANVMARSDDTAVAGVAELNQQYASGYQLLDEYVRGDLPTPVGDIPTMRRDQTNFWRPGPVPQHPGESRQPSQLRRERPPVLGRE